jgi:hypothetical protein
MSITSMIPAIGAIGALGTASFGLVDATKAFGGGVSLRGFSSIRSQIQPLFGKHASVNDKSTPLAFGALLETLQANWINGTALDDQKAKAKSLLKLRLSPDNSDAYAAATGVDSTTLKSIATKMRDAQTLSPPEADAFGRFDLTLTAMLDEGYQRADQIYRNSCKLLACLFSIIIAVFAGYELHASGISLIGPNASHYWGRHDMWTAFLVGLLATPLAPVAKDLTTALIAGVNAVQSVATTK